MNNIILFDDEHWKSLLPLSYTRPIADIRIGILTIKEKWERYLNGTGSYITQDYLSNKFPIQIEEENIVINSRYLPNKKIARLISQLDLNEAVLHNNILVAAKLARTQFQKLIEDDQLDELKGMELDDQTFDGDDFILNPYDIFKNNGAEIRKDFELLTLGKNSQELSHENLHTSDDHIFIGEGAVVESCYLNADEGPIYIGPNAKIMQGSMIKGPFALCEGSTVKMGAKIYGNTTIGPHSKVGGELNNVVIQSYSNKAHDGFLGNAVIGEWCNLGADTNNSNLKNNYSEVKMWDYASTSFKSTGMQFCGLIMGDHSKTAINTMINTGTVIGVSSNIYGSGFPRNFIPSFSWGSGKGYTTYKIEKSLDTARLMMTRRGIELDESDIAILEHIYHNTSQYRQWES